MQSPVEKTSRSRELCGALSAERAAWGRFGSYRLEECLARSSRFQIWRARHADDTHLQSDDPSVPSGEVILKTCHVGHGRGSISEILHEIETTAKVSHPNVAQISDVGVVGNFFYAAMEYVCGRDLSQMLGGRCLLRPTVSAGFGGRIDGDELWPYRSLPVAEAMMIAHHICEGLKHVHDMTGGVHGELSPWRVMVGFDGVVKILNVGLTPISSRLKADGIAESWAIFRYKSPEQIAGGSVDERSDLYSLSLMLYEMLTAGPWLDGDADSGLLYVTRRAPSIECLSELAVPSPVKDVLLRALQPDRTRRFQSAAEMARVLRGAMDLAELSPSQENLSRMMWRMFQRPVTACGSQPKPPRSFP